VANALAYHGSELMITEKVFEFLPRKERSIKLSEEYFRGRFSLAELMASDEQKNETER
jgi:hypothetical protein